MEPPPLNLEAVPADHRSGYVTLVGKPNAGKSTLLNALLGRKLSIVTPKAQTTRHRILGIYSDAALQIIFLDTPGIIEPRYKLQEIMMHTVAGAVADADLLVFLADAQQDRPDTLSLKHIGPRPAILAINKIDLIRQEEALPLVAQYTALRTFEEVIPISALIGYQLDVLMHAIQQRLPLGPPFYPKDVISEYPERFFIAEIIREKVFEQYRQEVPYSTAVNVINYEANPEGKDLIDAEIVVERDSQKGILIGKGGQALKQVGTVARKDIEAFLGKPVFLKLFVKVRSDWRNRDVLLRSYGYE